MEKSFVKRNLRSVISYSDISNYRELQTEESRRVVVATASEGIKSPSFFDGCLSHSFANNKPVWMVINPSCHISLKLLSKNISSVYNVSQPTREKIVKLLISFIKENSSFWVVRYDVKSFYESFHRPAIINKLKSDGIVSRGSIKYLDSFFSEVGNKGILGLPRGVGLSAYLSELMMQEFDESLKKREDVLFYARFVDDIIIIADAKADKSNIKAFLKANIPKNLKLHERGDKIFEKKYEASKKIEKRVTSQPSKKEVKVKSFSYLGYKFKVKSHYSTDDTFLGLQRRDVCIDISDNKVKKIKDRLIRTFTSYLTGTPPSGEEYQLLFERIKFLTGNYKLVDPILNRKVLSGIHYNYKEINDFASLKKLDVFFRGLLFDKSHRLSKRIIRTLPLDNRRELSKYSFSSGYHNKTLFSFSYETLKKIQKVW